MTLYVYHSKVAAFLFSVRNAQGMSIKQTLIARQDGTTGAESNDPTPLPSSLDDGTKGGIVIGLIVGVLFLAAAVFMVARHFCRRRQYRKTARDAQRNSHSVSEGNGGPLEDTDRSRLLIPSPDRPRFDHGAASTELPDEETRGSEVQERVGSWMVRQGEASPPVYRPVPLAGPLSPPVAGHRPESEAELVGAEGNATYEVSDVKGTRFIPVELPAAVLGPEEHGMISEGSVLKRSTSVWTERRWESSTQTWMT